MWLVSSTQKGSPAGYATTAMNTQTVITSRPAVRGAQSATSRDGGTGYGTRAGSAMTESDG